VEELQRSGSRGAAPSQDTKEVVALRQHVSELQDKIRKLELDVSDNTDSIEKYAEEKGYGSPPECWTKFVDGLLLLHVLCKEAPNNPRCGALIWDLCAAIDAENPDLIDAYAQLDREASAPSLHDLTPMHIVCSAGRSYPAKTHEDILTTLLSFNHSVTKPDCGYRQSNCLQIAACSMPTDTFKFYLSEALFLKAVKVSDLVKMRHPLNGASLAMLASLSNGANKKILFGYGVPLAEEDYSGWPINSYVPNNLQRQRGAGLSEARFERLSSRQQSQKGDRGSQPGKGGGSGGGGGGGGGGKGYKDQQSQKGDHGSQPGKGGGRTRRGGRGTPSGVIRPIQREGDGTASSSAFLGRTRDRHDDDVDAADL
jgi:hypothetical protein